MTDDEIRIAVAEACGWVRTLIPHRRRDGTICACCNEEKGILWCRWEHPVLRPVDDDPGHDPYHATISLPNYCKDLNSIHEAVKTLGSNDSYTFGDTLARMILGPELEDEDGFTPNGWGYTAVAQATARQRAEAFLKTLQLWKDEE